MFTYNSVLAVVDRNIYQPYLTFFTEIYVTPGSKINGTENLQTAFIYSYYLSTYIDFPLYHNL